VRQTVAVDLSQACKPERTAFIVYDMQVGVISQLSQGNEITANVGRLLAAARTAGYRVFFTRHMWLPENAMGAAQLRRAAIWNQLTPEGRFQAPFTPGSPGWQITSELEPGPSEAVVDKITMSAFCGTYLDLALRDANIDSFVIAGIALEIGIEPTVRHACDLNYIPIVPLDACGGRDEDAKQRAIDGFAFTGEAFVTDTETLERVMLQNAEKG
jgi:biuret amidohydrolase